METGFYEYLTARYVSWAFPWTAPFVERFPNICTLAVLSTGVAVVIISKSILNRIYDMQMSRHLAKKREERRQECKQAFDKLDKQLWTVDTYQVKSILALTTQEILLQIKTGQLKVVDVLQAYQSKALEEHRKTNCLIEPIKEAKKIAEQMDLMSDKQGLLFGIPVSIKDEVFMKNYTATVGASQRLHIIPQEDSAVVKMLRKHGAIPFIRTMMPQLGVSLEPGNPIYGTVKNPHKLTHNPGGSSSGEGALIGGGGSLLGIGSDIGGSIRVPSHFCGICGFKPTSERVSHLGNELFLAESSGIPVTFGPLARDVDSLVLAMKVLWDGSLTDLDPECPPIKFNGEKFSATKRLKIGYFYDNGLFSPVPACKRAVDMAKAHLEKAGHQLVKWDIPDLEEGEDIEYKILLADGGEEYLEVMKHDEVDPTIAMLDMGMRLPKIFKWIAKVFLKKIMPREAMVAGHSLGIKGVTGYWLALKQLQEYKKKVTTSFKAAGLDAVICPPMPFPALPLGNSALTLDVAAYAIIYNVLNWPAGVVRMTKVKSQDLDDLEYYIPKNKTEITIKKLMSDTEGLPVGVQVAALKWQDEMALRVMKEIEQAADFTTV